jgi:CheY-like chemotaxis protein
MSAQKQADLQLQIQRDEMAHRNRVALMGEMTASFAHELNQPLTAIANNASAARRFLEQGNLNPTCCVNYWRISRTTAGGRRSGSGNSQFGSQRTEYSHPVESIPPLPTRCVWSARNLVNRESVVTTELDPQLPLVNAAPVQIQQVLLNLIINALDAVEGLPPSQRRIIISTRSDSGDVAEVVVRDYGVGLPKDQPARFSTTSFPTKTKGMGMGLTIVRSIVEAYKGTITAENATDRGAARDCAFASRAGAGPTVRLHGMTPSNDIDDEEVCLIDDDPSYLKSMHQLLASEGFIVRSFSKAEDFLAHAITHSVPVVVTDIWMDRITGLEVLARLCAISPQTRVIVITAREDLAARATAMAIGPVAFFMKPFDDEKFIVAVRDALAGSSSNPDLGKRK